jgi:hypothetical protein
MSYVLKKALAGKLKRPLPPAMRKGVSRILVEVAPDHEGTDSLFFHVVLTDDPATFTPSMELGRRLSRIAAELRRRAAEVPGFAYVDFMLESELPRHKRKPS